MYYHRVFTHLFYLMTIVIICHFGKTLTGTFTLLTRFDKQQVARYQMITFSNNLAFIIIYS